MSADGPATPHFEATSTLQGLTGRKPQTILTLDGKLVIINRVGRNTRFVVGKGEKRIPVAAITAVQWKPAGKRISGFIQLTIGGGNERRTSFGNQTLDAVRDENSVVFTLFDQPAFEVIREAIETAMMNAESQVRHDSKEGAADIVSQLSRLRDLRDEGVLTEDEFETAKTRLLRD